MILEQFINSTKMSDEAAFDMIEIHMAHGYLLSSFISQFQILERMNMGHSENRMRFPIEVLQAVGSVWPQNKPISCKFLRRIG